MRWFASGDRQPIQFVKDDEISLPKELNEERDLAIEQEETKVLWDYYAVQEEEGLERFEDALSKHEHF